MRHSISKLLIYLSSLCVLCQQSILYPAFALEKKATAGPAPSAIKLLEVTPALNAPFAISQQSSAPSAIKLAIASPSVVAKAHAANDVMNRIHLTPLSRQIAEKLELIPVICELDELSKAPETDLVSQIKSLKLKQKLNETVLLVTLEVRDVAARIDRQTTLLNRQREFLEDRRDKAGRLNSFANVISNGVMQEIGQAGEMKVNEIPGEETELVAGGLTILLGMLALKQESGKKQVVSAKPNLLAKVFDKPVDNDIDYPPIVWWYLNTAEPGAPSTDTRRQDLLNRWRKYGILSGANKPADNKRTAVLSNTNKRQVVTINLLADQASLLSEVRSEVFQLDHDLLQLLLGLQAL